MPPDDATGLLISTLTNAFTGRPVALGLFDISKLTQAIGALKGDPHARSCVFTGVVRESIAADPAIREAFIAIMRDMHS